MCATSSCVPPGKESGGFSFTVTDGEHTTPLYQFVVTARPLTITMVTQEELVVFPGSTQISLQTSKCYFYFVRNKLFQILHMGTGPFSFLVFKSGIAGELKNILIVIHLKK